MSLGDKSERYRAQLENMCRTLSHSQVVNQRAPAFGVGARQLLEPLRAYRRQLLGGFRLSLDPNWKVALSDRQLCGAQGETEIHFGGEIVFREGCLERQVLTVVIVFRADEDSAPEVGRPRLVAGENHVVRRFHFDFDRSVAGRHTPPAPLAHLQVGGHLNQSHLSLANGNPFRYEVFDQLDCPRLPWTITDLPIILDMFLRQFRTGMDELIEGKPWRKCVMESERLWLVDHYRRVADMMDREDRPECLYEYLCRKAAYS